MPSRTDFTTSLNALKSLGPPRVWSMLVSIFGDLEQEASTRIDGPLLTKLTDGMNIKPEAVRVALHRLRNDNWINSIKSGRTASHALTSDGLKQRNSAAPLIYSPVSDLPAKWQIAILQSNDARQKAALDIAGFVPVAPRIYVANDGAQAPFGVIVSEGKVAPDWAQDQVIPSELTAQFSTLLTTLNTVKLRLTDADNLTALDRALLRCLIVHNWRRLVLRHAYLPPSLVGTTWPGHLCREQVVALLDVLPRPTLSELMAEERPKTS
ncbi:MAG: PaaX family transcriptional regulator C-terminal domain-containing protein [Aliishimia sp.]